MEKRNLAIIGAIIIICIIVGIAALTLNQPEETQIKVLSNSSLYNGENVTIQLTTENGTPVVNQSVNVTIVDSNGGRNVQNLVTDGEGKASFTLGGVTVGNYTLECSFGGSDGYKQSNCTSNLEIKEIVVESNYGTYSGGYSSSQRQYAEGGPYFEENVGKPRPYVVGYVYNEELGAYLPKYSNGVVSTGGPVY